MPTPSVHEEDNPFDEETWSLLPSYFDQLPNPVQLRVWGDSESSFEEREAARIASQLAERFTQIECAFFPRRANYLFYPVLGVFTHEEGSGGGSWIDKGVRLIGLPSGYQITSLIVAIQAVSFRGTTLEPATRLRLRSLADEVRLELLTAADDEAGPLLAKTLFGLAVASPAIRAFLIMADSFPAATTRYSATQLPHLVINGRYHLQGVYGEEELLRHIAAAVR